MISYLIGTIQHKNNQAITLEVNGVGYEVFCTTNLLMDCVIGNNLELSVYTSVKENAIDLYGFEKASEKDMFKLLLSISGVGPKSALSIMNNANSNEISEAVSLQDTTCLTIKGIGKKTAEKILAGLKGKIKIDSYSVKSGGNNFDLVDALISLGYNQNQITNVLSKIPKEAKTIEDKIKEALKII